MKTLYQEERICKNCGKTIYVLHPSRWAYKRRKGSEGYDYYCTWKCFREEEKGKTSMKCKITPDKRAEAIRIALDGGDVVEFLRKNGSVTPDKLWWYIKNQLKQKEPETYAKLPQQKKAQPKKKKAAKKPALAEVVKKLPEKKTETAKLEIKDEYMEWETKEKEGDTVTVVRTKFDQFGCLDVSVEKEQELKVKSLYSNVIEGAFFAKGERGVPMSIKTYTTMTLVSKSSPFVMDNQLKDCRLELTKEEWLKLIDEINTALVQMGI